MKTKKLNRKLVLKKTTVSHLNTGQMHAINGGATEIIGCTGTCMTVNPRKCPVPEETISCNGCTVASCTFTCQC